MEYADKLEVSDGPEPLNPLVDFNEGCARFAEVEIAAWVRTFEILQLPFNCDEFRRELKDKYEEILKTAIFYGGNLLPEEVRQFRLGAAHSQAVIEQRVALLRQHGTFDEHRRFHIVA